MVICEELREKYDMLLWSKRRGNEIIINQYKREMLEEVDDLQERFRFSDSIKLLLIELAENGKVLTNSFVRVRVVEEILDEAGYTYKVIPVSVS